MRSTLKDVPDDVEFLVWDLSGPAARSDIDIVVPPYLRPVSILAQLNDVHVRLVQSQLVGYDGVEEVLPQGVVFANAASVHETATAELTLGLIIAAQRGIPDFVRAADVGQLGSCLAPRPRRSTSAAHRLRRGRQGHRVATHPL